jgi:hypothetical protein
MRAFFVSAQPLEGSHGGGVVSLGYLKKHRGEFEQVIEIHRGKKSPVCSLFFRSPSIPVLALVQLALPIVPWEVFSRLSFRAFAFFLRNRSASFVLNYTQLVPYAVLLRPRKVEVIVHDVLYDAWRGGTGPKRHFWRIMFAWEVLLLRLLKGNSVLTFLSDKDRGLLEGKVRLACRTIDVLGLLPGHSASGPPRRIDFAEHFRRGGSRIGLLGAWKRPENRDGAQTFLDHLEPLAAARVEIFVAGEHADCLTMPSNCHALGFVERIDDFFDRIDVFVSPLDHGAGIKVKVLEALTRNKPMLITRKSCEGIAFPSSYPVAIFDDSAAIASFINSCLAET